MNFSLLCRNCIKDLPPNYHNKFTDKAIEMFLYCTKIQVAEEDELPKHFCEDCLGQINFSYNFIVQAQETTKLLLQVLSESKNIQEPDEHSDNNSGSSGIKQDKNKHKNTRASVIHKQKTKKWSSLDNNPDFDEKSIELFQTKEFNEDSILSSHSYQNNIEELVDKSINEEIKSVQCNIKEKFESKDHKLETKCPETILEDDSSENYTDHLDNDDTANEFVCLVRKNMCKTAPAPANHVEEYLKYTSKPNNKECKTYNKPCYHNDEHAKKEFVCNTCGKRFRLRKGLVVHALTHSIERPFICDQCHMSFKMKQVLIKHMRTHRDVYPYLCHICAKGFKEKSNLKEHMPKHTGEQAFACSQCSYRTSYRASLSRHTQRHSNTKPNVCLHCQKAFFERSALQRHIRTHTGEKPFKCSSCTLSFVDHWKRKMHIMRVHQVPFDEIPRLNADGQPCLKL